MLTPDVARYLDGDDSTIWEREPLEGLARDGELSVYHHDGFWQPMDTQRDMRQLQAHVGVRRRAVDGRVAVTAEFWRGRRVLVTGHTGFKGSWLALWLGALGAEVSGLADGVPTEPSLFELAGLGRATCAASQRRRPRRRRRRRAAVAARGRRSCFHLAAQPLVRRSFREPRETYEINVMGTVNVLDAVRLEPGRARGRERHLGQVLREPRVGVGLPRGRADGRPRPVLELEGRVASS